MAKELHTEIEIHAAPEIVWNILTDFEKYPEWNPFIQTIRGTPQEGTSLVARIVPPGSGGMTFKPRLLKVTPARELRWIGVLGFKGLFDGEHRFELIRTAHGHTRFLQSEKFTGILSGMLLRMIEKSTRAGFESMNQKIKERAEAKNIG